MSLKTQKGQTSVEADLILVVVVATAIFVSKQFREHGLLANLVEGPWSYVDGMTQHGVWAAEKKARNANPFIGRRMSTRAEREQ